MALPLWAWAALGLGTGAAVAMASSSGGGGGGGGGNGNNTDNGGSGGAAPPTPQSPQGADTSDWTDADIAAYQSFCSDVGSPLDAFIPVWMNESNCLATAHNASGDASGIFQLMPSTAQLLGWDTTSDPTLAAFRQLSVSDQIAWAEKFYAPYKGYLKDTGSVYTATFLPALVSHASDPTFVLCGANGPYAWAYTANEGFDTAGTGNITVQNLIDAAARAVSSARGQALLARVYQGQS